MISKSHSYYNIKRGQNLINFFSHVNSKTSAVLSAMGTCAKKKKKKKAIYKSSGVQSDSGLLGDILYSMYVAHMWHNCHFLA